MSDRQQWAAADSAPWLKVNETFDAIGGAFIYAQNVETTTGLVYGLMGGIFKDAVKAATTTTLADNATNYVVAHLTTGAITDATSTTNWDDDTTYARVAKVTTLSGVITEVVDYRFDEFGLFAMVATGGGGGGGGTELTGLTFTSDTGSTADSDPGNGLFKWNNATEGSATVLYLDNETADAVSLTTLWTNLPQNGLMYFQQSDDAALWQLWRYTAHVDGTGYRKFTVALMAKSSSDIVDAKTCFFDFDTDARKEALGFAVSDETTALTTGTAKITFRMPYAFTLTDLPRGSLKTAQGSGSIFTVDINEAGSTILSTKLTIDNTEKTSTTAATPAVLSDTAIADDAEMTVDIDQVGDGTAIGLKIWLIGRQA